jgi:hypothetical protein
LLGQITGPVKRVAPLAPERVIGNRIDGEIAAGEVVLQSYAIGYDRMPAVGRHVPPKCGDLVQLAFPVQDPDGSVLDAYSDGLGEECLNLFWRGAGRYVVV